MTSARIESPGWALEALAVVLSLGIAGSAGADESPPASSPAPPAASFHSPVWSLPPAPDPLPPVIDPPADPQPVAASGQQAPAPEGDPDGPPCDKARGETGDRAGSGQGSGRTPWWSRVPVIQRMPPPAWFFFYPTGPTGPGYYTFLDLLRGQPRQGPPKYPYPRKSLMMFSFFNADFRYLDDPKNREHDLFDFLKRVRFLDNTFMFTTGGELRYRYNHEIDSRLSGRDNVYDLTRLRAYGDLWLLDYVRIYAEFLSAQSFNQDLPPLVTDRDYADFLNLFADVKAGEYGGQPAYFRVGRQELLYGSQRLISPLEWANTRRTFQGAKLFWQNQRFSLDAFCVQPVMPDARRFDSVVRGQVFSGLWFTYRPTQGHYFDLYYLDLDDTTGAAVGQFGRTGAFNVSTVGSRYIGNRSNWLWDAEGMLQFGSYVNQGLLAKAFTAGGGYAFADVPMLPTVWLYYDYASGDPDPGATGVHRTFNQLFPFGHYYFGMMDLVGRQNINDVMGQIGFFPTKWILAYVQYHVLRLDSPKDALYNSAGMAIRRDPTGRSGTDVGEILTGVVNFHLDNHQDIFLQYSHLYSGDFIRKTGPFGNPDYLYLQYSFRW